MIVAAFDARQAKLLKEGDYLSFKDYPGLRLVAGKTRRSWIYRYNAPDTGKQKQTRLGLWPALALGEAVAEWEKARGQRSKGVDVATTRRAEKQEARASAQAHAERKKLAERTCGWLVERYLQELVDPNRKAKGAKEARRMLEAAVLPIADLHADEVTRVQAHEIILGIARRAPRVAGMTRQELRACWEHGGRVGYVKNGNPWTGRTLGGDLKAPARKRCLNEPEVGALLQWMAQPNAYSRTATDALELTLRTGLRSGEVCGIHSRELGEREGVLWLDLPADRMKAGEPHSVPLVGRARAIVESRIPTDGGFLFPARKNDRPIDQKVLGVEVYAHSGRSKAKVYASARLCPVKDWAPHDLRRTARTLLAELGCPFEVGEAILAHALPGVARHYIRSSFAREKLEWLTKLNERIDKLTTRTGT